MTDIGKRRPTIVILATGGTIAGRGAGSTKTSSYDAAVLQIDNIISAVPELNSLATIRSAQIMNLPSKNLTDASMIEIAKHVAQYAAAPDVDGIVVTHGTDTIEETSYFLNLTLKTRKPVVFVGAMRPSTALSADGPMNLYDAVRVASDDQARDKGILVSMNGEIFSARDVTKRNTYRLDAFDSPLGPLGLVIDGHALFYRASTRTHTNSSDFDISKIERLPNVQVVYSHGNASDLAIRNFVRCGVEGLIITGTGNANFPDGFLPALREAREARVHVVLASRTGSGSALRDGPEAHPNLDWIYCDDQNPQKARLLLALGLTRTRDPADLQAIFQKY